ncbi:hypothetical protein LJR220_005635 [Bradyrhizobium sp. LjRoot220]|uniref:hypothetical protein n=1 Tax=Bradyrhizobium sp. LjRoot220 TaxID=3342284 RepID=UPI003ED09A28
MKEVAAIDRAIDDLLVQLGKTVLRLSSPQVTKRDDERRALIRSVNQYSVCAARSDDPRVHELEAELNETIRPQLRLVASR